MEVDGVLEKRSGSQGGAGRYGVALLVCALSLPLLIFVVSRTDRRPSFDWIFSIGVTIDGSAGSHEETAELPTDELLGGLLTKAFHDESSSCLSRFEAAAYWKSSIHHLPSPHLVQKLRRYEALHERCGPNTELYRRSVQQLKSNQSAGHSECNYVVWLPSDGLGNRIITIVSAFLYALLNDKVLLLDLPDDLHGIFCEPFPETSWILPSGLPIEDYRKFDPRTPQSYGNMLKNSILSADMDSAINISVPTFAYLHLRHDYSELDRRFFCEESQLLLHRLPWLLLRSNQYFAPALFLVSQYVEELDRIFPEKEAVFHHLARYLLHPNDQVWGYVTRYYEAYLANARERVGIQIRILPNRPNNFEHMVEQLINCSLAEKLLPDIDVKRSVFRAPPGVKHKAVLVTNLNSGYFDKLRNMYYEHPSVDGEVISVYQPSHEEVQHTEQQNHNIKALSEMYLLSFSDVLVTSAWSTFGYVAQGLGGLKPWILLTDEKGHPACRRAMSMEPCYHAPQTHSCRTHRYGDKGSVVRHVRHCEDVEEGLKLFD